MTLVCKVLFLVNFCFPLTWAEHGADACKDETSLLQHKQVLKHSGERLPTEGDKVELTGTSVQADGEEQRENWPPTPVHDAYAIVDSTPDKLDDGMVTDAFDANLEKVKDNMEADAAENLEFANMVREERKANFKTAYDKVQADGSAVKKAWEADRADVKKVKKERESVVRNDIQRVAQAKEDAEAHAYKKMQARSAAIAGRVAGAEQASTENTEAKEDMMHTWEKQEEEEDRKDKRDYLKERHAMKEAAINKATERMNKAEQKWVKEAGKWKRVTEAEYSAQAALHEDAIEGPEGMKNHMLDHEADRAVAEYSRSTFQAQDAIDAGAESRWPHGYWPAGP